MPEGLIVKALSGFYYVQSEGALIQCRGRGVFRKRKQTPLVGDYVEFEAENETDGYVMAIKERKNQLNRPPIANVDQAILVFSAKEPDFHTLLLDRFLVHIEQHDIKPVLVISKTDLLEASERDALTRQMAVYGQIGYPVLYTSTKQADDPSELLPLLANQVSVIAGQSGVGKSSLLNALAPEANIETNEISRHLGRGRHTTRHTELLPIGEGLVADTPGFSSLEFTNIEAEDLRFCFPEFLSLMDDCKFRGCLHDKEPKCAIKGAVKTGDVDSLRYKHYLQFLHEIQDQKRRY
ncbi:putative ribosome biogenesis GTPase RsgA [Shouchella clausii]|uniref:ribosome small subunit-dependent GTPase A n=1 Tax=Shouchella tritolerans TaxID=2979466 RepID=UPI0007899EDC|nr:ribosome small subunit-dependent GTPase A [Shouchella tritolerans]GIN11277.1 putative ribosome biogenesis GTPase RsgA [Shouchella clausii]